MSADKDRGVRREKQKRAKDMKRAARQQRSAAPVPPVAAKSASKPKAA
jgi:hypothetical protein